MKTHLHIAIPMSIQFSVLSLGVLVLQAVSNSLGEDVIVGFTIALRVEQLVTQPLMAIGLAVATFAAQNYGAGLISRIRGAVRQTTLISFTMSLGMSLFIFLFGHKLVGSFLNNPNPFAVKVGADYLNISIMFYFFLGMIFIYKNTLQSMGKPFYPVLSGFVELGIRTFISIYLTQKIGYTGIYYASPLAWIGGASVVFTGYYLNVYRKSPKAVKKEYRKIFKLRRLQVIAAE
jgi:Na+-driven multidrug efflux pump